MSSLPPSFPPSLCFTTKVLGFLSLAVYAIDILLGFLALRSLDESQEFADEKERSKSVVFAVRSGMSFAEARRAAVSLSAYELAFTQSFPFTTSASAHNTD